VPGKILWAQSSGFYLMPNKKRASSKKASHPTEERAGRDWLLCLLCIFFGAHLAIAGTKTICQNTIDREDCADCCVTMSSDEANWNVLDYCKGDRSESGLPFHLKDSQFGTSVTLPAKAMEQACKDYLNEKSLKESIDDCLKICRSKPKMAE
jgi:hypothetical protein